MLCKKKKTLTALTILFLCETQFSAHVLKTLLDNLNKNTGRE